MREPKNARYLATKEEAIARSVFKNTIPYNQILISDGLGDEDKPFTVPTSIPLNLPFCANFNVKGGKFVIHAGEGYYGMSSRQADKELLIHELVHVWQGSNDTSWSWAYVIFSVKDQLLAGRKAYEYDARRLKPWNDYGPEQQAQIVEDWYAAGMKTFDPDTEAGDRRFYYIKKHIWGEQVIGDWTLIPIRPLELATLNVKPTFPDWMGPYLLPILQKPLSAEDHASIAARVRKLVDLFQDLSPESSRELSVRLHARRPGDKLAEEFHYRLATSTRQRLMHILRTKWARGI
jgi:hypothetical protein